MSYSAPSRSQGATRAAVLSLALAVSLGVAACSSSTSSSSTGPSTTIGAPCNSPSDCGGNLFCYHGSAPEFDGQCTVDCTATATSDSCKNIDPNTACLVAGICARQCGNGETCPSGVQCNTVLQTCERYCDANGTTVSTSQACPGN